MVGELVTVSKSVRTRKFHELTATAARSLGARPGYDGVGETVLELNDRASGIQCCAVPCLEDPEDVKVLRSARRNASESRRGRVLGREALTEQHVYVSCLVPCCGYYNGD
jgi:hypothetical protein